MRPMRAAAMAVLAAVLAGGSSSAQTAPVPAVNRAWSFSASAAIYFPPEDDAYVQPTVTADRGRLHLEGRFNYEDLDTGSVWIGINFSAGDAVSLEITPMFGAVFGNTAGIAPGYKGTLAWRRLALYSETEYVINAGESADSFLYTWSELSFAPADWCRFGAVIQRTKLYQTSFDIQRGVFLGVSYRRADVTAYYFNPGTSDAMFVLGFSVGF
jgi:hypothetical protein